jgi:ATP-dependent helicase/nuclease subunit B
MGKVCNIPFSSNFIEVFTNKVLETTSNFKNPGDILIIFPHKRLQIAFFQQKIFDGAKSIIFPKTLTFSSIDENILEFDGFCKDLPKFAIGLLEKKVMTNHQLTILLKLVIENLKQQNDTLEFDSGFLDKLNIVRLKKAIFEFYHYQYSQIFPYSKNERIFIRIIQELENYLLANNLTLKATSLNVAVNAMVGSWDHTATKKIFAILPQTDVRYISHFLDNLAKYNESIVFIRGLDRSLHNKKNTIAKNHHQYHIASFLDNNQIDIELIEDVSKPTKVDDISVQLLCNGECQPLGDNINILAAKDQNEESKLIAIIARECLEMGLKNIIIQTKSADLATKIESFLKLWGIEVDNLLSISYKQNQEITLFLLVAQYINLRQNNYFLLLDILKSKFCKFNETTGLKDFEVDHLRKLLFREHIADYFESLEESQREKFTFLLELEKILTGAKRQLKNRQKNLYEYFQVHIEVFNFLRKDSSNSQIDQIFLSIEQDLKSIKCNGFLKFGAYIAIVEEILSAQYKSTITSTHCPVRILQTFETRNLQHEMLIFAGLNEGIFPDTNLDHRYFHHYTRTASKLKSFDIEVGFMEYDFINSLFNENVVLSYSESLNAKTAKCRWLEKLLLCNETKQNSQVFTQRYRSLLQKLQHTSNAKTAVSNYANIEVNLRPSKISVSGVEKLISNPYVYYAKYIAKLNVLEDVGRSAGLREFGIILHESISKILCRDYMTFEDYANDFRFVFNQQIEKNYIPFKISKLWSVRLENAMRNLYQYTHKNPCSHDFSEVAGGIHLEFKNRQIHVHCIADKIELGKGSAKIIDYKTGYIPSSSEVSRGVYPQLAIEKFILMHNGFKGVNHLGGDVDVLYLDISGKSIGDIESMIPFDIKEMENGLKTLLEEFLCNGTEFFITNDVKLNRKNLNYRHLMRR